MQNQGSYVEYAQQPIYQQPQQSINSGWFANDQSIVSPMISGEALCLGWFVLTLNNNVAYEVRKHNFFSYLWVWVFATYSNAKQFLFRSVLKLRTSLARCIFITSTPQDTLIKKLCWHLKLLITWLQVDFIRINLVLYCSTRQQVSCLGTLIWFSKLPYLAPPWAKLLL